MLNISAGLVFKMNIYNIFLIRECFLFSCFKIDNFIFFLVGAGYASSAGVLGYCSSWSGRRQRWRLRSARPWFSVRWVYDTWYNIHGENVMRIQFMANNLILCIVYSFKYHSITFNWRTAILHQENAKILVTFSV